MNFQNFVSQGYNLDSIQFDCSRVVNLYQEVDENFTGTDSQPAQLVATPGKTLACSVGSGSGIRGMWETTTGECFFAAGNQVYQLTGTLPPFTATSIGYLLTNTGPVNFADNAGLLWIVDGPNGYVYQGGVYKQIVDPAWQGADFVCVYDSYFLFNVPGTNQFYWSDINSPTFTLNGGYGVDAKQGNSDPIVGMTVYGRILWLIGSQTTEMWTDNPQGTTTFQRIPGPYIQSGCISGQTVAFTEYGGMWVAVNNRGGATVVITPPQGYSVNRCSTFSIEQQLQQYDMSMATAFVYQQKGHVFYQINPPNGNSSFVYDLTASLLTPGTIFEHPVWHERTYTSPLNIQSRDIADKYCYYNGYNLCGDYRKSVIYYYDYENYTDNGDLVTRERSAPHFAHEFNRVFFNSLTIECKTGVGSNVPYVLPTAPGGNTSCGLVPATPTLTWTASTPGSSPLMEYQVYRSTSPTSGFAVIATVSPTTLTYTDTTGVGSTIYYYYIVAVDTRNQASSPSATQSCTIPAPSPWTLAFTSPSPVKQIVVGTGTQAMALTTTGGYQTLDGGTTWTSIPMPAGTGVIYHSGWFDGYFAIQAANTTGTNVGYYSSNVGATWTAFSVSGANPAWGNITSTTGTGGQGIGTNGNLFLGQQDPSTGNVNSWEITGLPPLTITQRITGAAGPQAYTNGNNIGMSSIFGDFGINNHGTTSTIYQTSGGGGSWSPVFTTPSYHKLLYGINSSSGHTAFGVDTISGVFYVYQRVVTTWTLESTSSGVPSSNVLGLQGYEYSTQQILSSYGNATIVNSSDGITWSNALVPTLTSVNAFIAYNYNGLETNVYALGAGGILLSTDGINWSTDLSGTLTFNGGDTNGTTSLAFGTNTGSGANVIYKR